MSVLAVNCGEVVAHVTVDPAVSVEQVYVFGPPEVSAAWMTTLPELELGTTGLIVKVSESMFAGVVASSA
ncbi:MAG TPA: hypothetical protein VEH55_11545 [Gaiellaceae bacterium]|nr:hypothetical protein [Gaiellaceae bacterium]